LLGFLVPLKHPKSSYDYDRVLKLLKQTLRSIEAQLDPRFFVVVVCNQKPSWAADSDHARFVETDLPPPPRPTSRREEHTWVYRDKGVKTAIALRHAQDFSPTHVMPVDADDFVSNRLAGFVATLPRHAGWFMKTGLVWSGAYRIAEEREEFWSYCGTSHILRTDLLTVPRTLSLYPTREEVIDACGGPERTERIFGDHNLWRTRAQELGHELTPLPFVGSIYHTETGENSSRVWWRQSRFGPIWGHALPPQVAEEFGLPAGNPRFQDRLWLMVWRARSRSVRALTGLFGRSRWAGRG
jgi:hypothetical protein